MGKMETSLPSGFLTVDDLWCSSKGKMAVFHSCVAQQEDSHQNLAVESSTMRIIKGKRWKPMIDQTFIRRSWSRMEYGRIWWGHSGFLAATAQSFGAFCLHQNSWCRWTLHPICHVFSFKVKHPSSQGFLPKRNGDVTNVFQVLFPW